MFASCSDQGQAGDNVGVLVRGLKREDVERGQVLAAPKSSPPHTESRVRCTSCRRDEGGRHTPFFSNYRPQFYFRTTDVDRFDQAAEGVEMVMPGDNVKINVTLGFPIAMDEGLRFAHP